MQNRILRRELLVSPNPVKPVAGYELSPASEIVKKASRQSRSLLFRDLFGFVAKKGWFA